MEMFEILDIIGIIAFTISGFLYSIKKDLDLLGVVFISTVTALAGGVIRDIIINSKPFIFTHYYPLSVVFITMIVLSLIIKYNIKYKNIFILVDAIGLVTFAITGTMLGIENDFNIFGIIFLGTLTAVGGGVVRDITLNNVPYIFKADFYATIAIIISILYFLIDKYIEVNNDSIVIVLVVIGVIIRFIAVKKNWGLPKFNNN